MKNDRPSIDGFVPRRPRSRIGELQTLKHPEKETKSIDRSLHTGRSPASVKRIGVARSGFALGEAAKEYDDARFNRKDLTESLDGIDDDATSKRDRKRRRKAARFEGAPKKPGRRKKIIIAIIIAIVVAILAVAGYLVFSALKAGGNVLQGNIFDIVQTEPLKEDANGRSNFLVIGTSEDDPGHDAGWLTDSIMVVSVDQETKNAYMISIPRDLYVDYELEDGCSAGYRGKINAYFNCVSDEDTDQAEQERLTAMRGFVGNIVGLDIQYGVHVNYSVVRDVINAIGGSITVNIEGNGATPAGIPAGSVMDANFDWKCGATQAQRLKNCAPRGHYIDYGPGEQTLDAEHALYLAQARGDAANWGLAQSNFDREKNQQKVLVAIKEKALSAGTLTNLGAVSGLINALGNNLRTNVQTDEIRTLMNLATEMPSEEIRSISLVDAQPQILSTGSPIEGAGSIVFPTAGVYDYSAIQAYIAKSISSDPIVREAANISVLNGSGVGGAAQAEADRLMAANANYTIDEIGDAPDGDFNGISIYQIGTDNPETAKALGAFYGVTPITTAPPFTVIGETDFVVIVGVMPEASGQ